MTDTCNDTVGLTALIEMHIKGCGYHTREDHLSLPLASQRRWYLAYLLDLYILLATLSLTLSCLGFRFDSSPTFLDHSLSGSFSSFCSFLNNSFDFHPTFHSILCLDYPINTCDFSYSLWPDVFQIFICSSDLGSVFPVSLLDISMWVLG